MTGKVSVFRLKCLWVSLFALGVMGALGGCANSPWATQIQQSLAADPRLQDNTSPGSGVDPDFSSSEVPQLPANFPAEIPRYPNAELVSVTSRTAEAGGAVLDPQAVETRWRTADSVEQVQQFYQERFQTEDWQVATEVSPLQASRDGLQVRLSSTSTNGNTEFSLEYQFTHLAGSIPPDSSTASTDRPSSEVPRPGDPSFIGPLLPTDAVAQSSSDSPSSLKDIDQAPTELRSYIHDLVKLGVLPNEPTFRPAAEISRRDYARWLVNANNSIYQNQPARKIRLASSTDQPVFQDVPSTDPDFGVIQGLANAGLIPSPLAGDSNATFRPEAPLSREELILWKVPVDLRQALPNASIDLIQQTWGFQDGAKISPAAMRAVLADYQNGDLSNIRRAFGYTTLFQPQKTVSRAEAAAVLWQFGSPGNNLSAKDALQIGQTPTPSSGSSGSSESPESPESPAASPPTSPTQL